MFARLISLHFQKKSQSYLSHFLLGLFATSLSTCSSTQSVRGFNGVDPLLASDATQVMVLGSVHLSRMENIHSGSMTLLLDRLSDWSPDAILIEATSGEDCDMLRQFSDSYPGVAESYCVDPSAGRKALGLSGHEARLALQSELAMLTPTSTPEQRRRVAALFFAAGEPYSAAVQWLHLPDTERNIGNGITEDLKAQIERHATSMNENLQIGARLAVQLGLERVYAHDDRSADDIMAANAEDFWPHMRTVWDKGRNQTARDKYNQLLEQADTPNGLIDLYEYINSESTQVITTNSDFRMAIGDTDSRFYGRQYVSWWQARGLRMVANIVESSAKQPGAKVLVIVGSSHKPYHEAYLDQMHDIDVVSTDLLFGM